MRDVPLIQSFGRTIVRKYPDVAKIVCWYEHHGRDVSRRCSEAGSQLYAIKARASLKAARQEAADAKGSGYSDDPEYGCKASSLTAPALAKLRQDLEEVKLGSDNATVALRLHCLCVFGWTVGLAKTVGVVYSPK